MRKRYNTPHRSRVVKTRMTEEEYAEFAERLSACNMSQAEFIRQAITGAAIRPTITVSPVNDELLAAVGKLTAEYGRIGGNLNQIARTLNEWHSPYPWKYRICIGGPQEQTGGKRCTSYLVRFDRDRPVLCRDQRILLREAGVGQLHL